jgi:hypothetical protein
MQMKSRKYESEAAAFEHLRSLGKLEYFGRAGYDYEYSVCTLHHNNGAKYPLNIYRDGLVVLREK